MWTCWAWRLFTIHVDMLSIRIVHYSCGHVEHEDCSLFTWTCWERSVILAYFVPFVFVYCCKTKIKNWSILLFRISDRIYTCKSKYSFFWKRIKPTSSRRFLGNANGPLYALKNFPRYTSDIYKEWFLAFYYIMITKKHTFGHLY
jgi:hypothetical protein